MSASTLRIPIWHPWCHLRVVLAGPQCSWVAQEPAQSSTQGPGFCVRSPDPHPQERVLGQESSRPFPLFLETPVPRVPRFLSERRGSFLAMEQGTIVQPLGKPSPRRSQPLPWNAEPPGLSPQTKCLLYELHVNRFPSRPPTAASACLAPTQPRGMRVQPRDTCSIHPWS